DGRGGRGGCGGGFAGAPVGGVACGVDGGGGTGVTLGPGLRGGGVKKPRALARGFTVVSVHLESSSGRSPMPLPVTGSRRRTRAGSRGSRRSPARPTGRNRRKTRRRRTRSGSRGSRRSRAYRSRRSRRSSLRRR